MHKLQKYAFALVAAVALATTGCSGSDGQKGADGAPGTPGANGQDGAPGVTTGTVAGTVTFLIGTQSNPASGVTVALSPDVGIAAVTTGADGTYELANVPAGVYSVKFSGNGYTAAQTDNVSVVATKTATVAKVLVSTNPLNVVAKAIMPAGFGATYTLGVNVSGGTAPYTYKWAFANGPTTVAPSDVAAVAPTFTAGSAKAVLAAAAAVAANPKATLFGFGPEARATAASLFPVSAQQLAGLTYNFTVTVTDAKGWTKTATVGAPLVTLSQGSDIAPRNQVVLVSVPGAEAAPALTVPAGSKLTGVGFDKDAQVAWFFPDVEGAFQVAGLTVHASDYKSSSPNCGVCHNVPGLEDFKANTAAKFRAWNNSAHGNHFFKFTAYKSDDPSDPGYLTLVPTTATVPTANELVTVDWANPGPMTTFEFGMTGAEGSHYSGSCVSCHTTGYNALAQNNGADDVMAANNYSLPNLATVFGGDATTKAPVMDAWNAMPQAVKNYAGMQCESCHGPINTHATGSDNVFPKAEFSTAACAVCHDRPSNHDRVNLWRRSAHANLAGAIGEAAVDGGHDVSGSCVRCHAGQSAVAWMKQQQAGQPGNLFQGQDPKTESGLAAITAGLTDMGVTVAQVQPITCQVCHDSHATQLRIEGDTKMLPAGFQVNGAGAGAICIVCHNSRNGARGDAILAPVDSNGAIVTSVGAPHEANQGDVYAGKNAYWVNGNTTSRHMAVADTCVGCHMRYFPAGITGTNTNHTFAIDGSVCKNCHGTYVNMEALEGRYVEEVAKTKAAIMAAFQNVLRSSATLSVNGVPVADPTSAVVSDFTNGRSMAFTVAVDGGAPQKLAISKFTNDEGGALFDPLNGDISKANWNFSLVQDGSKSIHNPTFVFDVLAATQLRMATITLP